MELKISKNIEYKGQNYRISGVQPVWLISNSYSDQSLGGALGRKFWEIPKQIQQMLMF